MISKQAVEEQLKRIGFSFRFWGRSEVNELDRILMEDEIIAECVNGEYTGGFAMLLVTNHRLLLVDKKPLLYLTVEDLRYEMITEFNFNHRLMDATINIYTANKTMTFSSWNKARLRRLLEYIQGRVLEMRQQQHLAQQFQAAAAAQYAQIYAARTGGGDVSQSPQFRQPEAIAASVPEAEVVYRAPQAPAAQATQPRLAPENSLNNPQAIDTSRSQEDTIEAARQRLREASRWTNGRATLGTYTRSKLPNLRRYTQMSDTEPDAGTATY